MNKTERKIKKAFKNVTPNVLGPVLSQCQEQKGAVVPMKKKNQRLSRLINVAASLGIVVMLFGIGTVLATLIFPEGRENPKSPNDNNYYLNNPDDNVPAEGTVSDATPDPTYDATVPNIHPDETSPNGVHYYKAFSLTKDEAEFIATETLLTNFPQLRSISSRTVSYEYLERTDDRNPTNCHCFSVSIGDQEFYMEVDEFSGEVTEFSYLNADWEGVLKQLDIIPKQKMWYIAWDYFNDTLAGDIKITIESIKELQISLVPYSHYTVCFLWDDFEYAMEIDFRSGEILNANFGADEPPVIDYPPVPTEILDAETVRLIAFEEGGVLEGYLNGEYQVYCKLYDYAPMPLYEVSYDIMHEDIGYSYCYIIDAVSGEILLAYHADRDGGIWPLQLWWAIDLCEDYFDTWDSIETVNYAKLNLDADPYWYISMDVSGTTYDFTVDLFTREVTCLTKDDPIQVPNPGFVTSEDVIDAVCEYTGCGEDEIEVYSCELLEIDGVPCYDLKVGANRIIYYFRFHAQTLEVLDVDKDYNGIA